MRALLAVLTLLLALGGSPVADAATTRYVFNCAPADQKPDNCSGGQCSPRCGTGLGAWTAIVVPDEFSPADLDSAALGVCFSAGFSVIALAFILGKGLGTVLQMFSDRHGD